MKNKKYNKQMSKLSEQALLKRSNLVNKYSKIKITPIVLIPPRQLSPTDKG